MARPIKSRRICSIPKVKMFGPKRFDTDCYIEMNLEEFETIRLIDHNNLTQEECANFMGVARTTVQNIYDSARKKLADALVNGKALKIEGGNYHLCNEMMHGKYCNRNRRNCRRFHNNI